jgi:hypothetical protein
MAKKHGVTSSTFTRFVIDAGAVYKNYGESSEVLLGATRGGNSFKIEAEQRIMGVDGAIGDVKGGVRIVNVAATITANFVEFSKALFLLANPGATAVDYPTTGTKTHDLITRANDVATTDYISNIAIVGNSTYSPTGFIVVKLLNVLADGNIELGFNDKDETVIPITFKSYFDPGLLSQEPWQILNPILA